MNAKLLGINEINVLYIYSLLNQQSLRFSIKGKLELVGKIIYEGHVFINDVEKIPKYIIYWFLIFSILRS